MSESVAYEFAKDHVPGYADRSAQVMKDHKEAMDCRDCETLVAEGLHLYQLLCRADENYHHWVFEHDRPRNPEFEKDLRNLFEVWLRPCDDIDDWIDLHLQRGYDVEGAGKFRTYMHQARAILKAFDEDKPQMSDALRDLRDAAMTEHQSGETAEFIPETE